MNREEFDFERDLIAVLERIATALEQDLTQGERILRAARDTARAVDQMRRQQ